MEMRAYRAASDHGGCLAVFDSAHGDGDARLRADFEAFLQSATAAVVVMEHNGSIIGCGGYEVQGAEARLYFGMIRQDLQRQGLGRFLLLYRLKEIGSLTPRVQYVTAIIPASLIRFYERNGLKVQRRGEGVAEVRMRLEVCSA